MKSNEMDPLFSDELKLRIEVVSSPTAVRRKMATNEEILKVRDRILDETLDPFDLVTEMLEDYDPKYRLARASELIGLLVALTETGLEEYWEIVYAISGRNWRGLGFVQKVADACIWKILKDDIEDPLYRKEVKEKVLRYKEKFWIN